MRMQEKYWRDERKGNEMREWERSSQERKGGGKSSRQGGKGGGETRSLGKEEFY